MFWQIYVLVITVFCIVCTVFLCIVSFKYIYSYLFFVLVYGLLPPSANSIAVNNNNNNNNNKGSASESGDF